MPQAFILEYWNDEGWLVGRLSLHSAGCSPEGIFLERR
jgi:hypothetical protein